MGPKKAVAAPEEGKEKAVATGSSKVKRKSIKLVKTQSHPPTLAMVVEALKKNTERKGTSVQAIRSRILVAHPTVDPLRLKFLLRTALNKGLEKGILIRPLNSSATGATGRFKLAKPVKAPKAGKEENAASENVDPNAEVKPQKKAPKKEKKAKTDKEPKGEKPKAGAKKAKEESDEKPKAAKSKKDTEAKEGEKAKAPAKKPKAKTEAAKAQKDSAEEGAPVKAGKKGKK
uniref:H1.8 linker histone n=1 Tax=Xenopus tropicalis TaxID=8364 RepID=A0A803J6M7_XENTR